jgi:hypothetical protein
MAVSDVGSIGTPLLTTDPNYLTDVAASAREPTISLSQSLSKTITNHPVIVTDSLSDPKNTVISAASENGARCTPH